MKYGISYSDAVKASNKGFRVRRGDNTYVSLAGKGRGLVLTSKPEKIVDVDLSTNDRLFCDWLILQN